jgi:hypothetical protein
VEILLEVLGRFVAEGIGWWIALRNPLNLISWALLLIGVLGVFGNLSVGDSTATWVAATVGSAGALAVIGSAAIGKRNS